MKKNVIKSFFCGAVMFAIAGFCVSPAVVKADMQNGSFVAVDAGVVDTITVNGVTVEALYRPYDASVNRDATYSCAALVKRFYSQVYGREVCGLEYTTSVPVIDSGSFQETVTPKEGDILRDNQSVHWAVVKSVSGNTVTVIQQNAWDDSYTKAWVGATVENGDPRYTFFTWNGNNGESAPAAAGYTISYDQPQIQENTAVLSAKVDNPAGRMVTQVGCYLWDGNDTLLTRHVEDCQRPESRFNMWYDVQGELGISLTPGTVYRYQFFVLQDGTEYPGTVETFTTAGAAPATEGGSVAVSSSGEPISTQETDMAAVSDEEVVRSMGKVREIFGWKEAQAKECLGDAYLIQIGVDQETHYFAVDTLMEKPASLILTFRNGKVVQSEWRYRYSDNSENAYSASNALYDQICRAADSRLSGEKKSYCTEPENMTTVYGDKMQIIRDMEEGCPYVSVIVLSNFQDILG